MGYSIMVEFPDAVSRNQMLSFLEQNLKRFDEWTGEEICIVRGPVPDPAYSDRTLMLKELLIGFDFTLSTDVQSRIAYRLCYWMIKRIPECKFWYDGEEQWDVPEYCDSHGFYPLAKLEHDQLKHTSQPEALRKLIKPLFERFKILDHIVHQELIRLTNLWEKEHGRRNST